ncbi:hypothetical protein [Lamprocystis purpurea]|uniref:hypothetical protein n=1 Tax=Lamprocystis purpurea TaxID=61598 RepID=UPI000381C9D2|nr:hypothetical protein [Lamprocystis purpurea]MBV5348039.1 hypothetical protein [bacterium]
MEKARDEPTWLTVYARLVALLDSGALDSLKRAFGRWIYRSFIRKKRPGIRLPDINDFQEVHVMLQGLDHRSGQRWSFGVQGFSLGRPLQG